MKNTIKVLGIVAIVAIIGLSMTGCNRGGDSPDAGTSPVAAPAPAANPAATAAPVSAAAYASVDPASINNWDAFLAEYERFMMTEYVPLVNRMRAGDMTVILELQNAQNKFAQWSQQMQVFALTVGEPTYAQIAKLDEITERIATAIEE